MIKKIGAYLLDLLKRYFSASENGTAQWAHFGVGATIVYTLAGIGVPIWAAAEIAIAFAFFKEFAEYRGWAWWEPPQDWRGSALDLAFWLLGIFFATFVLLTR